ncbi:hypothetical protein BGX26_009765 [Mortierella sp. AD094]|nr:hypothetical protein BGX26_009765 [Mortierella sp. AD094]
MNSKLSQHDAVLYLRILRKMASHFEIGGPDTTSTRHLEIAITSAPDGDNLKRLLTDKNREYEGVKAKPPVELSDAVNCIRGRIIKRAEGAWLVEDGGDLVASIWSFDNPGSSVMVRPFINSVEDLVAYLKARIEDEAERTILRVRTDRKGYRDLLGPHEPRDRTLRCVEDPKQVMKAIEFWRQERRQKRKKQ